MKYLKLTQNRRAIVDDNVYNLVKDHNWCVDGRGYPQRRIDGKAVCLHQLIWILLGVELGKNEMTDHINRDKLDNRLSNLRIVSSRENIINRPINKNNSSGFKGVTKYRFSEGWIAQITVHKTSKYLGIFKTKKEAAEAYNRNAEKYFGKFAYINKI
jgi:hypothetical protein